MDVNIIDLIISYAVKTKDPLVDYDKFINAIETDAQNKNQYDLLRKIKDHVLEIVPVLMQWEFKGKCTILRKESKIDNILIHFLLEEKIRNQYLAIENDPPLPFPSEQNMHISIPPKIMLTIDIRTDFISTITDLESVKQKIIKINFPDNVLNLVVTKDIFKTKLIECSIYKMSSYLQLKMNAGYISSRLEALKSGSFGSVKSMFNDILTRPKKVISSLFEADDLSFKFWSQFTNIIIQDYREKKDKLIDEHGYCQAAYIIGLYIGYQKAVIQREHQRSLDLKQLEKYVKRPPYAFTLDDFYNFRDNSGVRYIDKYSKDFIHEFIKRTTKIEGVQKLPYLIRVKVDDLIEYFIQKDYIIPLFINKLYEVAKILKTELKSEWTRLVKNNIKTKSMKDDDDFSFELRKRIKSQHKLLYVLLNPHLLYITKIETSISQHNAQIIAKFFHKTNKLKPLNELLNLDRKKLLGEVKAVLPIWYTWPIVKHIFFIFRWLMGKSKKSEKRRRKKLLSQGIYKTKTGEEKEFAYLIAEDYSSQYDEELKKTPSGRKSREHMAKYRKALKKVKTEIIGLDENINEKLKTLAEKWNPLYNYTAKINLVEDVNCLIRDFLRSIKKSFKVSPPTAPQIRDLARHLAGSKTLKDIKRKESLRLYIEAYMIKILEEKYAYFF